MNNQTEQHDAFREQRKSALYWLRLYTADLAALDVFEDLLPAFVRQRYCIGNMHRSDGETPSGTIALTPLNPKPDDPAAVDALHADVEKLRNFLFGKCPPEGPYPKTMPPTRTVNKWTGLIGYEFFLPSLPGFEGGLTVTISSLPAGSACHITKKVLGTKVVEDVEYEMVCDDQPGISPEEHAEEAEREAAGL